MTIEEQLIILTERLKMLQEIGLCDRAIKQYEELGISGTPHDLEHREMRRVAVERLRELER